MNSSPRFKLFLMMVLEIFIWGAWLPLIFGYLPSLGFSATEPPKLLLSFFSSFIPGDWLWVVSEQSLILNAFPVTKTTHNQSPGMNEEKKERRSFGGSV